MSILKTGFVLDHAGSDAAELGSALFWHRCRSLKWPESRLGKPGGWRALVWRAPWQEALLSSYPACFCYTPFPVLIIFVGQASLILILCVPGTPPIFPASLVFNPLDLRFCNVS